MSSTDSGLCTALHLPAAGPLFETSVIRALGERMDRAMALEGEVSGAVHTDGTEVSNLRGAFGCKVS